MLQTQKENNKRLVPLRKFSVNGGYSAAYLSILVQRKKLKAKKVGRNYFTTQEWFDEYLEIHARDSKKTTTGSSLSLSSGIDDKGLKPSVSNILSSDKTEDIEDNTIESIAPVADESSSAVLFLAENERMIVGPAHLNIVKRLKYLFITAALCMAAIMTINYSWQPESYYEHQDVAKIERSYLAPTVSARGRVAGAMETVVSSEGRSKWEKFGASLKTLYAGSRKALRAWILEFLDLRPNTQNAMTEATEYGTGNGVLIMPLKDSRSATDTIRSLQTAFSDPVEIEPQENGSSGIIRPVIDKDRSLNDHQYLYMMVPITPEK